MGRRLKQWWNECDLCVCAETELIVRQQCGERETQAGVLTWTSTGEREEEEYF